VLGAASPEEAWLVLGEDTISPPGPLSPPGRGFARLGAAPVLRLQVPATPDPLDDAASETERQAVLRLLPQSGAAQALGGLAVQASGQPSVQPPVLHAPAPDKADAVAGAAEPEAQAQAT